MQDHDFEKALLRIHGMIIPWRVAAGLQRMLDTGYLGRVTIEGRDVTTGLPREISVHLNQLRPPADGDATSTRA
jgi:hypothetical protein